MRIVLQKTSLLIGLFCLAIVSNAQSVSDSTTYTNGAISTVFDNNPNTGDDAFGCSDTLTLNIGANRYITGVDVYYSIEATATGNGWVSDQRSFLEFINTGATENAVTNGDANWDSAGVFSYARTGLSMANGNAGTGDLAFLLHGFRTFGNFPNCSQTVQQIVDSTFKIVVHHIPQPTCIEPTGLAVVNRTTSSVELSWTTGGASNWQIEYGPVGFTSGTGTLINVNSNPYTVGSLSAGVAYDFQVRDSCAVGDVSFWSNTASAFTLCNTFSAPFFEDFESADWNTGLGNFGLGTIDTCWARNYTSDFVFKSAPKNFNSATTGTDVDHTSGTAAGKYILSERLVNSGAPYTATIVTPSIELSSLTVPQLSFWYHMYGANIGTLSASISTDGGVSFTSLWTLSGQQQTSRVAPWLEATVDLTPYLNDTIIIEFKVEQSLEGGLGDVSLDDVSIRETPTCLDPTNLAVDFAWIDQAGISWTTGGATDWELEYGAPGFALGSGTRVGASNNPTTLNNLTANTSYEVYVRDSCGAGDVSNWVGPVSFTTYCATALATPYLENFDSVAWTTGAANTDLGTIENCWLRSPLTPFAWKIGPAVTVNPNSGTQADHTSGTGQFVYSERLANFANDTINALLLTPPIDLNGLTTPQLSFWYHMFGNSVVSLTVEINTGSGFNTIYTRNGQQQTSTTDTWREAVVNLSAYTGDTAVFRFTSINNNGGTNNDVSIDDLSVDNAPSCPDPTDLSVLGSTHNSVSLQWVAQGSATMHNIEYGAPGFTLGSGTYTTATSNPANINGLSASTTYAFYVRDSCAAGDVSAWIGPITATTDCLPISAPFSENFDGTAWAVGTGTAPGTIDPCWRRDSDSAFAWTIGQNGTPSGNTGPDVDHTSGTGKFAYTETYFGFAFSPNVTILSTPLVDLSSLTDPELKFYYHMFGADINELEVSIFDGQQKTVVQTLTGAQQNSSAANWNESIVDLASFIGDTIKVEFKVTKAVGISFQSDVALDDITIDEKPTCPKPSALSASNATANSIDLAWNTGGATDWQIEYGPTGFTPGTGTIVSANSNPFTVNSLNASTTYDFYVRDSCGAGSTSDWVGPATLNTLCVATIAPFFENFDGPNFDPGAAGFGVAGDIDVCWSRNPIATYFWKAGPSTPQTGGTGSTIGDHTSGSGGYIFTESGGFVGPPLTANINTPEIDLSPLTTPELSYWYHMFGPNVNDLYVEVSTNSGVSYTAVDTLSGNQQTAQNDPWLEAIVDLSAYANQTIVIRFRAEKTSNGNQSDISIDDVRVDEAPNCPKPSGLMVTGTSSTTVDLNWTTGGASNWQVVYGPTGYDPSNGIGTGTLLSIGTNPTTVSGLSPQTDYCFYVRDSCAAGDVSDWSTVICVTTDCAVFTAPFTENFDGTDWTSGTGATNAGSLISNCWNTPTGANPDFSTRTGATASGATGPTTDVSGTGNYIFTEGSFGALGAGEISSPLIYIPSTFTAPRIGFQYHMYGADIDSLQVLVEVNGTRTAVGSIVGQQQTANASAWLQEYVDISSNAGDTVRVIFIGTNSGFNGDIAIDEVTVDDAPACPEPTNLVVTATGPNSITLSWTTGGATNWQIEYGAPGFIQGNGTLLNASTNPFTVNGLNPQTGYEFYVRDSCGATSLSPWVANSAIDTTQCGVFMAPYTENFDGPTFISGGTVFNPGSIDDCWNRTFANSYFWATEQNGTVSANTGPSGDHTTGVGKFMFTDGNGGAQNTILTSPFISLANLSNPELRFWYHMYGAVIDRMEVEVWDGNAWVNEWSLTGQQQTANADPWQEAVVSLSTYGTDTIQVRFIGYRNFGNTASDMALDDVWIGDSTSCATPDSITLVTATTSTLEINWNTFSTNGSIIKYRPVGSSSTFSFTSALGGTTTLTGLQTGTAYEIFVRDSCGTEVSLYTPGVVFSTLCGAVIAPYLETFDGVGWTEGTGIENVGDLINDCWTRASDTAIRWTTGTGGTPSNQTGPFVDFNGGGNYIYTEATIATGTSEIESPRIFIPTFITQPTLEFYYHMFGQDITSLSVEIDNGSGYTLIKTITGQQQANNFDAWLSDTADLSAYSGDTVQLKFVGINTGFRGDIAIDNVSINGGTGGCTPPSSISFSNIGSTSATVSWMSNSGLSDIEVVLQGNGQGTGVTYTNVSSPFVITNLNAGTVYDVYIRDVCAANGSIWISDTLTTTGCLAIIGGMTISNKTATGFDVSWTSNSGTSAIEVVPSGGAQGSGTLFAPVVSPFTISSLNPSTTYDIYIRDICGTDSTAWISDTSSTLACPVLIITNMTYNRTSLTTNFSATISGQVSQSWDFGDGNSSTQANPTHTYAAAGTYTVVLQATNICGNTVTDSITAMICDSLAPSFTFTNDNDSAYFNVGSSSGTGPFYWDFGNGNTGTGAMVSTPLTGASSMTVTLIADNACGDSVTVVQTIQLCQPPLARWTYSIISTSSAGMLVQFDGTQSINATTYQWSFGDGNTATGTAVPQHTYLVPSLNYFVSLTVGNPCGNTHTHAFTLASIGLDESANDGNYALFPNPSSGETWLEFDALKASPQEIELFDLSGRKLPMPYSYSSETQIQLDIAHLPKGTYLLQITDKHGVYNKRISKH